MRVLFFLFLALVASGCAREISSPPVPAMPNEASRLDASTYKTLYSFKLVPDGFRPTTALVDLDGVFYGTTTAGGYASSGPCESCGTLYSISPSGSEKVLYKFPGPPGGSGPDGDLIIKNGALYGTTFYGGNPRAPRKCSSLRKGCGVVFEINRSGEERILHAFRGGDDGENPDGGVIFGGFPAPSGYYGTTSGSSLRNVFGTVFTIGADGEQPIYAFAGPPNDGQFPIGSLAMHEGKLYGVTATGGVHNDGTVFEVTPKRDQKAVEKILHSFSGPDGSDPVGGLKKINGLLYGVASAGGPNNSGVLFAITPSGSYHIVHAFRGVANDDGADPQSPPILVKGTILYGTTYRGGTHGFGTVYEIDQHGKETILHSFGPAPDGIHPKASLLWHEGTLYGTTVQGGEGAAVGTVFSLTPP